MNIRISRLCAERRCKYIFSHNGQQLGALVREFTTRHPSHVEHGSSFTNCRSTHKFAVAGWRVELRRPCDQKPDTPHGQVYDTCYRAIRAVNEYFAEMPSGMDPAPRAA
jgi:hypothetical protein